jgi:hypothetical protein
MCVENYEDGSEIEREQEKNTHIDLGLRETLSRAALTIHRSEREIERASGIGSRTEGVDGQGVLTTSEKYARSRQTKADQRMHSRAVLKIRRGSG